VQPVEARRGGGRRPGELVGQFDRLAEVGGGLLEGGASERLVAGLAPPLDRRLVETGLGQMVGDEFRLGRGGLRELLAQAVGDLPM
jgi:xanthine/CO dehydrogenase XdhC/CoxF family maturation factor